MAGKELKGREKVVSKMTRDGLTEENLADGSVKDISHKSRGRPPEMKQDFVFDREKKKDNKIILHSRLVLYVKAELTVHGFKLIA